MAQKTPPSPLELQVSSVSFGGEGILIAPPLPSPHIKIFLFTLLLIHVNHGEIACNADSANVMPVLVMEVEPGRRDAAMSKLKPEA